MASMAHEVLADFFKTRPSLAAELLVEVLEITLEAAVAMIGNPMSNGPITYELDGRQYLVVAAGDTVFGFVMNKK